MNVKGFWNGNLRIKVTGNSPERFVNLCSRNQILLWNIVQVYDVFYMNINLKDIYAIKPLLRKTGTKVIILDRYGLPFFVKRMRKRKAFLIGFVLCIVFWYLSGMFIWRIEFYGNYRVTEDMLKQTLKAQGIHIGTMKKSVDILEGSGLIREAFDEVTWASMGFNGTTLTVHIKEKDEVAENTDIRIQDYDSRRPVEPTEEVTQPPHLYAPKDGTIQSIVVRSGIPKVKKGDVVSRDQVLVEGLVPIMNEDGTVREYMEVIPDADILLEHSVYESFTLPYTYVNKRYTGRVKKHYYLFWNENHLELPQKVPFLMADEVNRQSYLSLQWKEEQKLGYGIRLVREFQNFEYEYSLEQAEKLLGEQLDQFLASLDEKGVHIIRKDGKIDTSTGQWKLDVELLVQEYVNNG